MEHCIHIISLQLCFFQLGFGEMYGSDIILSWKSVTPFEVRYMAIATAYGNTGRWQMEDDLGKYACSMQTLHYVCVKTVFFLF